MRDVCPDVADPDQADADGDGEGDACEADDGDADDDGVPDAEDNCPDRGATRTSPTPMATGSENDCDPDSDGNGFVDSYRLSGGGCASGGDAGGLATALALALVALLARRRQRPAVVVAVALAAVIGAGPAQADSTELSQRFRLSSDRGGLLDVEWGEASRQMSLDVALWLGWADDPLVVLEGGERIGSLVDYRLAGDLIASLAITDWLAATVELPLVVGQEQDSIRGRHERGD